jgi:hypothetical protein
VHIDNLAQWYCELEMLARAQFETAEWEQVQLCLNEADVQAKALARREMVQWIDGSEPMSRRSD